MTSVMQARTRKTKLYFEDNQEFMRQLHGDLKLFQQYCLDNNIQGYVRLNGTSDIDYSDKNIFNTYNSLRFYDYTKIHTRQSSENYHLTYSRSESTTDSEINIALENNMNVAVVFDKVPESTWNNHIVIQGDLSDMRWDDQTGVIVGLKAKGKAKLDYTNFVVRVM